MSDLTGGCACGAVRYRLTAEPDDTGWCHCRTCQRSSGAPALVFFTVPRSDLVVETGAARLGSWRSSKTGRRGFCRDCGTPLTIAVDWQPGTIDVAAATLDDPAAVHPGFHIFYAERIDWAPAGDALPRHDRWRSGTDAPAEGD